MLPSRFWPRCTQSHRPHLCSHWLQSHCNFPLALGCHRQYRNRFQQITLPMCYADGKPRGTGSLFEFMRFLLLASENRILVNFHVLPVPQNKGGRHSRGKCYMHTFTPIIQNTAGRSN